MPPNSQNVIPNDQNQIINQLDGLLLHGHTIDEIVAHLDGVRILANYHLLIRKGASSIDLVQLRDSLNPVVVYNYSDFFRDNGIEINTSELISRLDDWDLGFINVERELAQGVDPQMIADRYMGTTTDEDFSFVGYLPEINMLAGAGAQFDGDLLVDRLMNDYTDVRDYKNEIDIQLLRKAGVSTELLSKLQNYLLEDEYDDDDQAGYDDSIIKAAKIFFNPEIQVINNDQVKPLQTNWSGRILPGQTIRQGIAAELREVYGYEGTFEWNNMHFEGYVTDRKGQDIKCYRVQIRLHPTPNDRLPLD